MGLLDWLRGKTIVDSAAVQQVVEPIIEVADLPEEPKLEVKPEPKKISRLWAFYAAGTNPEHAEGKAVQKLLKDSFTINEDFMMTKKEMVEYDYEELFEYDDSEVGGISFFPEPDNPFDKNAVRIEISDVGKVGYVPKRDQKKLWAYLTGDLKDTVEKVTWRVYGGKVRKLVMEDMDDFDAKPKYTIEKDTLPLFVMVIFHYFEEVEA